MKKFLQSLSARTEFFIVVVIAFGDFLAGSLLRAFHITAQKNFSAHHLQIILGLELAIGLILALFLGERGWTLKKIGLRPTPADTAIGLALLLTTTVLWYLTYYAVWYVSPETVAHLRDTYGTLKSLVRPPVGLVVVQSGVNALFEEILVTGYVITALKRTHSDWFAVNVSVGLRVAYHLYQGQAAVLGVLPLALIYAWWFARTGRLWPLVVAHALQDIVALLA